MAEKRERYELRTVERAEEITLAPAVPLAYFTGGVPGYEPRTEAALVYVRGSGFLARLTSFEARDQRRAVCREEDGEVYRDSCLELFINFAPEKGRDYLNLEVNPLGTLHAKFGPGRGGRRALPPEIERPRARCRAEEESWSAEIFIPLDCVEALFGKDRFERGDVLRGNFYKCGDDCARPHYGMWSPVVSERPDFHRPEQFGELVIV